MATASTTTVILSSPSDWEPWLFIVKTKATGVRDVWKFINPDVDAASKPAIPSLPIEPTAATVNPSKATLSELTTPEQELFKLQYQVYRDQYTETYKLLNQIALIQDHIVTTISTSHIPLISNATSTYDTLVALKKRLAPTDQARKIELSIQYANLKNFSKKEPIGQWLGKWEKTYQDAKALDLPEVSGDRSLFDFTLALQQIDESYAATQEFFLNIKIKEHQTLPSLYDLVEDFHNHQRRNEATKSSHSHSAFATTTPRQAYCVCGLQHSYKKCYYLIESIRPANWEPDSKVQKEIDSKLAGDSNLKERVEDTISWMKWKEQRSQSTAFLGSF